MTPSSLSVTWALQPSSTGLPGRPLAIGRGVRLVQADPPGRPAGHRAREPLPRLRRDLAGGFQQFCQVADRAAQPAPPSARGGIPQHGGSEFGQARELPGHPQHGGLLAVAAIRLTALASSPESAG